MHPVALLSFFIPSVFMLFCLISLHYVNGINKMMMMMMMMMSKTVAPHYDLIRATGSQQVIEMTNTGNFKLIRIITDTLHFLILFVRLILKEEITDADQTICIHR